MTGEEKQQVQNIINARTKLLTEKVSRQEEQINSLTSQIEAKEKEINGLKSQLSEAQEQSRKLIALIQEIKPQQEQQQQQSSTPQRREKPTYLVSLLRQHFGYDSFRAGQEEVIDALLSGRDVFCSMPDGYGKSICYRLPALLMPGLTLAVTPSTPEIKINDAHSECLKPFLSAAKKREILRKIKNGTCKILYSDLNQLKEDDIFTALKGTEISMTAVISLWGVPDSMNDYKDFMTSLNTRRIPSGIFTNSTSPSSRTDLMKLANLRSPLRIVTGFDRENISFRVIRTDDKPKALNDILEQKRELAGVIYCSTPEEAYKLREKFHDIPGFDEKVIITPRVLYSEVTRKDIRFVIHYELPESLGDYSQEITPAGLDGAKSECIIIVSRDDFKAADRTVIKFCEAKNHKEALLSYLGQDGKFLGTSPKPETTEASKKFTPEDFSDFDFGTANEAQKEAITTTNGPLLIIAGPGTGKTYTLVQRAVFMIQKKHVKPGNIMLASFTDKSAHELAVRITEELSSRKIQADMNEMYTGTFHVICERILRNYIDYTRYKKNFRILDEFDQAYLILRNIDRFLEIEGIEEALRTNGKWKRAGELRDYINELSEELIDPEELIKDPDPSISSLGQALKVHDEILTENNSATYSALLVDTYKLLRDNPEILNDINGRIQYVMIDEYQDTNYVQEQLVFLLGGEGKNICVVGDDDQSLYRFRGATVRNILEFPEKFGKNECRIVRLMLNYRSDSGIIRFFSDWMNNTGQFFQWGNFRHKKKLESFRPSQDKYTPVLRLAGLNDKEDWQEKILNILKALKASGKLTDYNQAAFLFRSVRIEAVQDLSHYLENHNINVYSPRSNMFFRRGEIMFALGCLISMFPKYLKSLESGGVSFQGSEPDYISYYRKCLKTVAKFIDKPGYSDLKRWLLNKRNYHDKLDGYTNYTYSDLMYQLFAFLPFNHALNADVNDSVTVTRPARNLAKLIEVLKKYEHSYNINNIHSKYIVNQFSMMMNIFMRFQVEDGLDEYESDTESVPSGHVAFMTIHQAKGMEFPIVFVDSLWSIPMDTNSSARNNELIRKVSNDYSRRPEFEPYDDIKFFDFWRQYYVAFSRAKDLLILTCNENNNTPSRYFEASYNKLDDAEESFNPSGIELNESKGTDLMNTYSFTSHILTYEICPQQYKFYREFEFMPGISQTTFMGTLIHSTIEDIHKAVLNHEANKINEQNISEWFEANYEHLSRSLQAYLSKAGRNAALSQVLSYVLRQGRDWSSIRKAEAEVNTVRGNYILEGKIDLICMRDGEVEIVDFKSGPKPSINIARDRERLETYKRQLNVYAYLVEKSSGLKVHRMKIYYTGETGGSPEIVYQYDENEAEEVMKGFDDIVNRIQQKDFNHKTDNIEVCKECDFRYYCGRA